MLVCVCVCVVCDAGMSAIDCNSVVNLSQSVDVSNYYIYEGPFGRISSSYVSKDGQVVEVTNPGMITIYCMFLISR